MSKVHWILVFGIIALFISCKKETIPITSTNDSLNSLFNVSLYSNINEKLINDSTVQFSANNNDLYISGKFNNRTKIKTGWWSIYDSKGEKYLSVQFINEDGKERKNQVLFFKDGKLDTLRSKFYTVDFTNLPKIIYNFYTPMSNFTTQNKELAYAIFTDDGTLDNKKIECLSLKNNHHHCQIDISKISTKKNRYIGGIFSEYSFNNKSEEMGISEIFIIDTLTINN